MARGKRDGLIIAGGGLAGSLAALAMARLRPEVPLLLIEEGERLGGGRLLPFLDRDVEEDERWLLEPTAAGRWPGFYALFPGRSRKLGAPCGLLSPERLEEAVRAALPAASVRTGAKIVAVREDSVIIQGGEKIVADAAVDARGAANLSLLDLGWRVHSARLYRLASPHRLDRPVLVDATVDQTNGFRFMSAFPLDSDRLLVADDRIGEVPDFDADSAGAGLEDYVAARGWKPAAVEREESGARPLARGGDFNAFWRVGGARVAKIGARGGFFHPATGASAGDAVRTAAFLTQQRDLSGPALHDAFERCAATLWKKREPYRAFIDSLLKAEPAERAAIMARLYAQEPATIGRFHSAQLSMIERIRLGALAKPG
jgi:lycopene beta-cyclase